MPISAGLEIMALGGLRALCWRNSIIVRFGFPRTRQRRWIRGGWRVRLAH